MARYMIEWALDTEADDPHHAVRIALLHLQQVINKPATGANRFVVSEMNDPDSTQFVDAHDIFSEEDVDVWAAFQHNG